MTDIFEEIVDPFIGLDNSVILQGTVNHFCIVVDNTIGCLGKVYTKVNTSLDILLLISNPAYPLHP